MERRDMSLRLKASDAPIRRRTLLQLGAGGAGALGTAALGAATLPLLGGGPGNQARAQTEGNPLQTDLHQGHSPSATVGDVDVARMGFDPSVLVHTFDYGEATKMADGTTVREWSIAAYDKEIEIAPGVFFPAWTYNGQVPGPTLRANEGDRLRVHFTNAGTHPHTMHFHGIHSAYQDGVTGIGRGEILPGEEFTYEFTARPFGCHLYHCHSTPLKRHIHKGLYGAYIVNPDPV
jgi:FtsP/CotA-like multicopper oxidase with cupredoxin domain